MCGPVFSVSKAAEGLWETGQGSVLQLELLVLAVSISHRLPTPSVHS